MVTHLFWHDVKRNLRPIRALPVLGVAIFLAYRSVDYHQQVGDGQDYYYFAEGAFTRKHFWLFWILPILAGVMGGSLAAERRSGVTLSILAKGISRRRYVLAKLLGAAASSALITFTAILAFFVIVFTTWIPGHAPYVPPGWIEGPVEALFAYSPFAHDLLVATMLITAAAALSLIGVLAGLVIANEYVAMAATPIATILLTILMRRVSDAFNPEMYIGLWYAQDVPRWLIPFAPFLYWGVFSLVIATICQRIFAKKEFA